MLINSGARSFRDAPEIPNRRLLPENNSRGWNHHNVPDWRQQALKPAPGAARAKVIAPELFHQLHIAVNGPLTALDLRFRGDDFRRLRVTLKAGEVVDIAMLAHGTPPLVETRPIAARRS